MHAYIIQPAKVHAVIIINKEYIHRVKVIEQKVAAQNDIEYCYIDYIARQQDVTCMFLRQ